MPATVIGFTGAFGSGCSTAAMHLRDNRSFKLVRLSDPIRKKWVEAHPGQEAKRTDLTLTTVRRELLSNDTLGL